MKIIKNAYAKINLSLDLTGILPNGYHAINTVMQSVDLCDTVTLKTGFGGIRLACSDKTLPADEKNTAFLAAKYFFEETQIEPDADIYIEKLIPSQAGLGGGSADAAAVLNALNEINGYPLEYQNLLKIALKIGADVPFMIKGGTALCLNIGEVLAQLPHFDSYIVIAKPERGVSTRDAYSKFDRGIKIAHPDNDRVLYHFARSEGRNALKFSLNVFEQLCDIPEGEAIKGSMLNCGAFFTSLSGSGSAYFGLFESSQEAKEAANELKSKMQFVYAGKTVS
ncbi:MAG: 4-(cytidine 5'-diphospho)-2-C-methyl-D-erythritol kinase [Oscillospiraceae bacterium]|nr:4-(cytidine 5'-diphospho)-2-C-methyl-D-erythritol kinase [Oscillospiraceae bacterium]